MSSFRIDKVERLIKEEVSLIFLHKLQDPDLNDYEGNSKS